MPTYDYLCKKCGSFEHFQPITSKALKTCPKCKSKVERQIGGGSGIIFKGSGFYQTDYRSSKYQDSAKKDKPAGAEKSSKEASSAPKKSEKKE
jgi:putative FmdB family regulatory protein